jgi:hypothetical protein
MSDLTLAAFQKFSTTPRLEPANDLDDASITHLARGLQGPAEAELFIPREVETPLLLNGSDRLVIYDGQTAVHEGMVTGRGFQMGQGAEQGVSIEAPGFWGALLARRTIDKRWADNRLTEEIWTEDLNAQTSKFRLNRQHFRLVFTPVNGESYVDGDMYAVSYGMPSGETIKKVVFSYEFSEVAVLSPAAARHNDDADNANTFTDLPTAIDGDPGTGPNVTLSSDDYLYIRVPKDVEADGLRFNVGSSVNNNAATMGLEKYTGKPRDNTPLSAQHNNGGAFTVLTNAFDNNAGTSVNVTLTKDDYLYIRSHTAQIRGLRFDLGGTVNTNEARLRVQRYNADTGGWTSITPEENQVESKGTNDMMPFTKDGSLLWSEDVVTGATTVNGMAGLWWRITPSADLTAVTINEIYVLTGWESVTIADGTASGGATLAQDGDITFTYAADWKEIRINDERGFWLRLRPSATLDAVTFLEIELLDRQEWELRLRDRGAGTTIWNVTADDSDTATLTIIAPTTPLYFEFISRGNQRGYGNGTVFASLVSLTVYSETSDINLTEIARDCIDTLSAEGVLNSTEVYLNAPASPLALEPFHTVGPESWASILSRAASFGDEDGNEWRVYLRPSDDAPTPDGRPVLAVSQYPALTEAAYAVTPEELEASVEIIQDFASLVNMVVVRYTEDGEGSGYVEFEDEASIEKWGEFHLDSPLDIGFASDSTAIGIGTRYLAAHKDPKFIVSGPLRMKGYIRNEGGGQTPVAQIKAGVNIRLENFLEDVAQVSGAGLTFRITRVTYDDVTETAEIYTGLVPDAIEILLAQQALGLAAVVGGQPDQRAWR